MALISVLAATWWLVSGSPSCGQDVWKTAASGVWGTGTNWADNSTPGPLDRATFNLAGTYTVTFDAEPQAIRELNLTGAANVTFTSFGRTLPVNSSVFGGPQDVNVLGGASLSLGTFQFFSRPVHLTVGNTLSVNPGSTLNVRFGSHVNVGSRMAFFGQLNVSGSGSTVTVQVAELRGSTNVSAGGLMQTGASFIAGDFFTGAASAASVSGSRWISSGLIRIGAQINTFAGGDGTLTVTGGGLVESARASLGHFGHSGSVTVTGDGSFWHTTNNLDIGESGPGTVNIQPGGTATVGQDTVIWSQGRLRLQGGTFDTRDFSIEGGGQFEWTAGTLRVGTYHGNLVQPTGILAPGHSAGSTTIQGNYTQQSAGTLEIEIGGAAQGAQYDVVNVTGNALLGGQLDLKLINGFVPTPSQTFVISSANTISGAFSNAANGQRLTTADGGGSFLVNYGAGSAFDPTLIVISSFQAGLPGDFDLNGAVANSDLTLLLNNWGKPVPPAPAGWIGTPLTAPAVNNDELTALLNNWGRTIGGGSLSHATVPEPGSVVLMVVALAAGTLSHRRRGAVRRHRQLGCVACFRSAAA